jgi:hypothetical protein
MQAKLRIGLFAALLGAMIASATGAARAEGPTFKVDPFWPKPLPHNWLMGQVGGVDVDKQGHVWVMQRPLRHTKDELGAAQKPPLSKCCVAAPPVIEFDQAGNVIRAWGGPGEGYDWPSQEHGMRIDPKGYVWFGGNGKDDGMILKFTQDGKFVKQFGKRGPSKGSLDGTQFGKPADFWFDAKANEVYVADGYTNHRVIVMDMDTGAVKRIWGAYGNKPEDPPAVAGQEGTPYDPKAPPSQQFNNPVHCVKITVDNLVYVCDRSNDRLQVFRKDGTFVKEFIYLKDTLRGSVWDVYPWPDAKQRYLIMVDGGNNEMRVIRRSDGKILSTWGRQGRQAGEFHWVHNVAIDRNGNVYTSEVDNAQRLQRWVPTSGAPGHVAGR